MPTPVGSCSGEVPFDWEDCTTWAPALLGVGSVYVSYYPDLAVPGAAEDVRSFAEHGVESAVRRLVLLSERGGGPARRAGGQGVRRGVDDRALQFFSQNFSESFFLSRFSRKRELSRSMAWPSRS